MFSKLRSSWLGFARRSIGYRSTETARIIQRNLRTIVTPTHPEDGGIHVDALGVTLDPTRDEYVLKAIPELLVLAKEDGAVYRSVPGLGFEIEIEGVRLLPESLQEIFIVHEVFHEEAYSLESGDPMFVWDIGANVGTTSLYFAAVNGWDVAAYELFPVTAAAAKRNVERSGLSNKIQVHDFGIGARDERMDLPYNAASRGSNGFFGNIALDKEGPEEVVTVQVRDSAAVFAEIREQAGPRPILVKMDCEGAEFDIIPRLGEIGALDEIAAVAMEVHDLPGKPVSELIGVLLGHGYVVRRRRKIRRDVEMVYAVKVSR